MDHFFIGFADELCKLAGGAKFKGVDANGNPIFEQVQMPPAPQPAPAPVPAPQSAAQAMKTTTQPKPQPQPKIMGNAQIGSINKEAPGTVPK